MVPPRDSLHPADSHRLQRLAPCGTRGFLAAGDEPLVPEAHLLAKTWWLTVSVHGRNLWRNPRGCNLPKKPEVNVFLRMKWAAQSAQEGGPRGSCAESGALRTVAERPCPVLRGAVLSCPVLSCPVLRGAVLSCPQRSGPVLSRPQRSGPVLHCPQRSGPVLHCPQRSGPVSSSEERSCPVLRGAVLSCLILRGAVLSHPQWLRVRHSDSSLSVQTESFFGSVVASTFLLLREFLFALTLLGFVLFISFCFVFKRT